MFRKSCPKCNTKAKKYWKVIRSQTNLKAKCYKCGYIYHKEFIQEKL